MRQLKATLLSVFALIFLSACISSLPKVDHFSPSVSKVLFVGKIALDPPLESEFEQQTHWSAIGDSRIINKIFMATGDDPVHVEINQLKLSEWQNVLETELGSTFFLETTKKPTYLKGAMIVLDTIKQQRLWFPGDLYFDIPEGANAVYIGTLRYTRDDFNNIVDMEVIDEYSEAVAKVKQQLGNDVQLIPSLLKPVYTKPGSFTQQYQSIDFQKVLNNLEARASNSQEQI